MPHAIVNCAHMPRLLCCSRQAQVKPWQMVAPLILIEY